MDASERKKIEEFVARGVKDTAEFIKIEQENFGERGVWGNVTGHCLIEAARVSVFADILGFSAELKKDAMSAALLHDGHKRQEIAAIQEEMSNGGSGRNASMAATKKYLEDLAEKGVSKRVIRFIGFAGGMPEALFAVKDILNSESPRDEDVAAIIINYIDAYTRNDEWAEPAVQGTNDVDRRVEKNKNNPNYKKIGEEISRILQSVPFFSGMDSFEAMAAISHDVGKKLSELIIQKSGVQIASLNLPEEVDKILRTHLKMSSMEKSLA